MSDYYRLIIENLPDPFAYHQLITDTDGNPVDYMFIEVNPAFADMTGLSKEEIINKKGTEVHPGIKESNFDWISTYGQVALTGESIRFEQYFKPINRRYDVKAWGDGHGFFAALFCDITDKKSDRFLKDDNKYRPIISEGIEGKTDQSEEKLLEKEQAITSSLIAIALADLEGNLTYINPAFLRLWGYQHQHEVLGRSVLDFWKESDKAAAILEILFEKGSYEGDLIVRRADGELKYVLLSAAMVYAIDGTPLNMMASFVDITERKEMEKAIKYQLEIERIVSDISAFFVNLPSQKIDDGINYALKLIGDYFDVERSYVFQFSRDGIDMSNTHEWCKPGIEPEISNLQNIPVGTVPWWMEKLTCFETINIPCVEKMPLQAAVEKGILQAQSIQSVLVVPIVSVNKLLGFIGFDFVMKEMTWAEEQVAMLKVVAEIISNALSKQQAEQKTIEGHQRLLKIMDSIHASVYVADLKTHEILFMNRYGQNLWGDVIGETCWQALREGQAGPCDFCINDNLLDVAGKPTGVYQWEFKNTKNGRWYDCHDTALSWVDSRMVRLEIATDITERKHMQETLEGEKNKLSTILEKMLDTTAIGIDIMDAEGNVTFYNKAAEQISGYTAEEVIGNAQIFEWVYPNPEYRIEIIEKIQSMIQKDGRIEGYETTIRRKDGKYRDILWYTSPLTENGKIISSISFAADITERKQFEEALSESEERYRFLLNNVNEAIIVVQDELVKFANPLASQISGYSEEEMISTHFLEFIHPDDRDMILIRHRKRLRGEDVVNRYPFRIKTADGSIKWVELSSVGIEWDAKPATLDLISDITERKKMQEELIKVDKLESIGILAGGIAHDFNNYLTTLLGNISLAKLYKDDSHKVYEKLESIEKATLRAKNLSNQLFTFAKGATPVKKRVSINNLIIDDVKFALSGSNVSCNFMIADNLHMVEIDEGQFSQVLNNIVINALQAMPDGGIIEVAVENITIEPESQNNNVPLPEGTYIKISIKDEGTGIAEKHLSKIFDPFFTTKQKGSGFGLTTSFSIIKNHGGHLSVESKMGMGTTFYIFLPASTQDGMISTIEEDVIFGTWKILLMDDEEDVLEVTGEMLSALGYDVSLARDGKEAIEIYVNALKKGRSFDLVIMDLTVPGGMGGKDTIKKLLKKDPNAKAIVYSGYSNDPVMANYKDYGFKGVMKKPFLIKELSNLIHEVMS